MTLANFPTTETMNVSETRKQLSDLLNRVYTNDEQIVIEKNGIPMAGLVPMSIVRMAREKEASRQEFLQALSNIQSGFVGTSEEEAEREIEKALAEIKQERLFARRIIAAISRALPDAFESSDESLEATVAGVLKDEGLRRTAEQQATLAANAQ